MLRGTHHHSLGGGSDFSSEIPTFSGQRAPNGDPQFNPQALDALAAARATVEELEHPRSFGQRLLDIFRLPDDAAETRLRMEVAADLLDEMRANGTMPRTFDELAGVNLSTDDPFDDPLATETYRTVTIDDQQFPDPRPWYRRLFDRRRR